MIDLYAYPLPAIMVVSLAIILGASEIGWRLGVRGGEQGAANISTLESAMIGFLALLIGFTFAMALTRFEARRDAVVAEANAIGTAALRARLLPEPNRTDTIRLLKDYVQTRLDVIERVETLSDLDRAIARSNAVQEALWRQAEALALKNDGMVPTGLFIQALNDLIDVQSTRLAAVRNRVPNVVLVALLGIAVVVAGFAGYASGSDVKRTRLPVAITGILIASVIFLILDLDRPSSGFIRNDQQSMIDAAASIAAFPDE